MAIDGKDVYSPSPDCTWVAYNLDGYLHIKFKDGTVRKTECPIHLCFMRIMENYVYFRKTYDVEGILYNVAEDTYVTIDITDKKGPTFFRNGYLCFVYYQRLDNGRSDINYSKHIHKYDMDGLYVGSEPYDEHKDQENLLEPKRSEAQRYGDKVRGITYDRQWSESGYSYWDENTSIKRTIKANGERFCYSDTSDTFTYYDPEANEVMFA